MAEVQKSKVDGVSKAPAERAPPPSWLDAAFVQEALRRGGEDATVEDIQVDYAIAPGVNYCSVIFRVRTRMRGGEGRGAAQGAQEAQSLLVKILPPSGQWAALVQEARLFDRELIAFAGPLPAMDALLAHAAPGRFPPFAARCFHQGHQPVPFVVLEDLTPQGFRLADRLKGLDLPHALIAIRALGHFHGASAVLWKSRPELFDGLVSYFEDAGAAQFVEYTVKSLLTGADTIESWTDFPGDYANKVRGLKDTIVQKWTEINRVRPGKFNVLIHNDFAVNNLLFRYEDDEVRDVRFLDFQMSHVGNPAMDLIIFRFVALSEEAFDKWDTLLNAYREALTEAMRVLGDDDAPSLEDIQRDLEEARDYAFIACFSWLPANKQDGGVNLDDVLAADEKVIHKSPAYRRCMEKYLPIFDAKGMFKV